jgi:Gluconate 2-dehydrogenase subunit 3
MRRRDTIKTLLVGSLAGGAILSGCDPVSTVESGAEEEKLNNTGYGRTSEEIARDEKLTAIQYFDETEMTLLAVLCDLILPADTNFGSATDAGVPEFIEFIVKDIPKHQLPLRGGMMWLNSRANSLFNLEFSACSEMQQKSLLDEIAYPAEEGAEPGPGNIFFSLLRNLVLTGYYTTKMGVESLGYKGNTPNAWDGVPQDVLDKHGMAYDEEWLAKCIDQDTRADIARWDADGNLVN